MTWISRTLVAAILPIAMPAQAQVIPATPKKFAKRATGGSSASGGVSIGPGTAITGAQPARPQPPVIKQVVYFILGESRQWTNADGRAVVGRLIAFEEMVTQSTTGMPAAPTAEEMTKHLGGSKPTVVRDGKIRLLVNNKPFEIALDRLSDEDRVYVRQMDARTKPPAPPAAPPSK